MGDDAAAGDPRRDVERERGARPGRMSAAIAAGRYGDMIAVAGDPLGDVTLLQNVAVVIKGGVVVKDSRSR